MARRFREKLLACSHVHFHTIWNVRGEYLDMMLVQRSGDMLTASGPGGINEIQYALANDDCSTHRL